MSVRRKSIKYAAAAAILALGIVAASTFYLGFPIVGSSTSSIGAPLTIPIRLTDPPQVPPQTIWLNLTYSSLSLLVGEPTGTQGQYNVQSVPVASSATIDLLSIQNISKTIAMVTIPANSILYSVTFVNPTIKIDVSGAVSSVSLASGSDFTVTMAKPVALGSGDYALIQLNPVVVATPSGYQMIPSAVGITGHNGGPDGVGEHHQITGNDDDGLQSARGSLNATLLSLSVSGQVTTVTIEVNNTGSVPVQLMGLGLHGNFTMVNSPCQSSGSTQTQSAGEQSSHGCQVPEHMDQVVFIPVVPSSTSTSSTTTSTASSTCSAGQMSLVNGEGGDNHYGMTLAPGQCMKLTFTGQLSFGQSTIVLTPSTLNGQAYIVHAIASNGANQLVSCTLPLGAHSCKPIAPQPQWED